MTELPFMPMYWGDFFGDGPVRGLTAEQQGIYCLLLGRMWINGGWLPADDVIIARVLGMHTNTWRQRYKAVLTPLLTWGRSEQTLGGMPLIPGGVWTQNRLGLELEKARGSVEKRKAQTSKAREEKAVKSKGNGSVTVKPNGSVTKPVTDTVTRTYARAVPEPEEPSSKSDDGSGTPLPPQSTAARSLGLGGRSLDTPPPAPVGKLKGPYVPSAKQPAAPAPEPPRGQTEFLKRFEKFKAGDKTALDKHADVPERLSSMPSLGSIIRQQLGLEVSTEDLDATTTDAEGRAEAAQANPNNGREFRVVQPEADGARTGSDRAGAKDGDAVGPGKADPARNPDPGKPSDATRGGLSDGRPEDDDLDDFIKF